MDSPRFIDEEDIQMVHQDENYEDYRTPDTSRVDETSFTVPDTREATSTLWPRQNVKRDKINALYRYMNVTGDIYLIDLDRFRRTMDPKKGTTIFEFYIGR